jgi:uncharacterized protein
LASAPVSPASLAAKRHKALAAELLRRGLDVNARACQLGSTPLILAAVAGNVDLVVLLLQHGADPSVANARGETAHRLALRRGLREVAALLPER